MIASIARGLLVLVGVRRDDDEQSARRLMDKILRYRVFADVEGKMALDLIQIDGEMLLVPQFTLAADTHQGRRPGFSAAAPPELARSLYDATLAAARARHSKTVSGVFGANMQVSLVNDGPVTLWLES